MKKRIISMLFVCVLVVSSSVPAFAAEPIEQPSVSEPATIDLQFENMTFSESEDDGVTVTFDLIREVPSTSEDGVSPASIGWIEIVGWGKMRCRVYPENLMGYFDWSFHLDNGDYIKKSDRNLCL